MGLLAGPELEKVVLLYPYSGEFLSKAVSSQTVDFLQDNRSVSRANLHRWSKYIRNRSARLTFQTDYNPSGFSIILWNFKTQSGPF